MFWDENLLQDRDFGDISIPQKLELLSFLCNNYMKLADNQREKIPDKLDIMRPDPLGIDKNGKEYWQFTDDCWLFQGNAAKANLKIEKPKKPPKPLSAAAAEKKEKEKKKEDAMEEESEESSSEDDGSEESSEDEESEEEAVEEAGWRVVCTNVEEMEEFVASLKEMKPDKPSKLKTVEERHAKLITALQGKITAFREEEDNINK